MIGRGVRNSALALLALWLAACGPNSELAARKAAEAATLLDAGDLYNARQAALTAVKARDDSAANWIMLGRVDLAGGRIGDAYSAYSRAIELDATNIEALQVISQIALQAGRPRDASRFADQLLALAPNQTGAQLTKGFVALIENRVDEADAHANAILAQAPQDDGGIVLKVRVLARQDKLDEAAALLEKQLTQSTNDVILTTLIEVRRKQGDGAALEAALTRMVGKSPTDDRVFDLASVQHKRGRTEAARRTILARLAARPDDANLHARAAEWWIENDPDGFSPDRIVEIAVNGTLPMRTVAARVLLAHGRAQDAVKVIQPVMNAGTPPDLRALYASARAAQGAQSEALAIVDKVIDADETNAFAHLARARIKLASGDLTRALSDAQLVLRDDPKSVEARLLIIDVYRRRNDMTRARRLFEEATRQLPQNLQVARAYVAFLGAKGDSGRALEIADAYTKLNPARVGGWNLLGEQCRDPACAAQVARGRQTALATFTPDGGRGPARGMFGSL
ncbi:MAG: tetratricopeptide repeat protein [Sphingomonadaceae bacterium]